MAKIKLGTCPRTFKHKTTVVLLDKTKGEIEIVYRYRTKSQFMTLVAELAAAAKVTLPSLDETEEMRLALAEALGKLRETNADHVLAIAEGWDLESEFTRENIAQLCDELPGVAAAIYGTYHTACMEGRLGN